MELKLKLSIDNILQKVPDESIWHFIFKDRDDFELGQFFSLREEDTAPSANVFWADRLGRYMLKDFGKVGIVSPEIYLSRRENCSYLESLEIIRRAFSLNNLEPYITNKDLSTLTEGAEYIPIDLDKRKVSKIFIRYRARPWGSWGIDKEFWNLLSLDNFKLLKLFNVKPISHFWLYKNTDWNIYEVKKNNPTYCYVGNNRTMKHKLYTPLSPDKRFKWVSNLGKSHIFGLELLPENGSVVIIESSYKDSMVAKLVGIPAIPSLNETTLLPENIIDILKGRFDNVISHMNSDIPGINANKAYENTYNIKSFVNPGGIEDKDNFAFMLNHGLEEFKNMYLTSINNLI